MKQNHNNFLKLAFNLAKINLGKTNLNPSVGCVVVKNNSVISSGFTSIKGRPHAEYNALKNKKNYKDSSLYVTLEPCTHFGLTPPCSDLIARKGIKNIFYSFSDVDKRTANKISKKLAKRNITVSKKKSNDFKNFYQSYFLIHQKKIPFIDAKIAISKDYFTINKKEKWITNYLSRKRAHLIRSEYDAIVSTSKSINYDNSLLNCRLNGLDNSKPDLIIIDIDYKIKKNLNLFKKPSNRRIFIITSKYDVKKSYFFNKKKNVKVKVVKSLKNKKDFINLFMILKKLKYNRILVESGLLFLNELLKKGLIFNLYMFKSSTKLGNKGKNNTSNSYLKRLKLNNRVKVNLNTDNLYKIKLNNV